LPTEHLPLDQPTTCPFFDKSVLKFHRDHVKIKEFTSSVLLFTHMMAKRKKKKGKANVDGKKLAVGTGH
jgi:hypothetical protein